MKTRIKELAGDPEDPFPDVWKPIRNAFAKLSKMRLPKGDPPAEVREIVKKTIDLITTFLPTCSNPLGTLQSGMAACGDCVKGAPRRECRA